MAPWAEARGRLKLWREKGLRRSREVLQAWKVVEPHHKSLGDEGEYGLTAPLDPRRVDPWCFPR